MKGVHEFVPTESEFPPICCPHCKEILIFEDLVNGERFGDGRHNGRRVFWLDWDVACPKCNEEFEIGLLGAPHTVQLHFYDEDGESVYHDYDVFSGNMEVE